MIHNTLSFVAVVKSGSFTRAAKKIGVSKAQLSRNVKELEATLGIQLLYRTTRSLSLTESGEQFFFACSQIENTYEEAVANLKLAFSSIRGTLRITAPISFGSEFLPEILHQFTKKFPNIKVIVSLSSTTEDIIDQDFDLAIRIAPSLPSSSLRARIITKLHMVLCASPVIFENQKIPTNLDELNSCNCITSVNRKELTKLYWLFYKNKQIVKFAPNSVIEIDSLRAQVQLVLKGAGIGRIPFIFIEKELRDGRLIEILPTVKQPHSFVYLLYPNRQTLPKKTQIFIDFLSDFFTDKRK